MSEGFPTNTKFNVENCYTQAKVNFLLPKFTVNSNSARSYNNTIQNSINYKDALNVTSEAKQHCRKCQTAESEVSFLKDWLLLHLDLIRQQNEELASKERSIIILQQENEMLKEQVVLFKGKCGLESSKAVVPEWKQEIVEVVDEDIMTQDLRANEEDSKNTNNSNPILCPVNDKVEPNTSLNTETLVNICDRSIDCETGVNIVSDEYIVSVQDDRVFNVKSELESDQKSDSDLSNDLTSAVKYQFSVETSEQDIMHNLRMNIKRRRMCSNSSALSNNSKNSLVDDKINYSKYKKKRKRTLKDSQILTTSEPYYNLVGESSSITDLDSKPVKVKSDRSVLEVPRWRIKVYSSLYTMEGTENLSDDIFLKRHQRLEVDERRRKKWDAQRIREQRHIEKLRLRHEKIHNSNNLKDTEEFLSFWPPLEDFKFIEIRSELAISAFGCPIPKIPSSEFKLPWLHVEEEPSEKLYPKKRGRKRKKSKRC